VRYLTLVLLLAAMLTRADVAYPPQSVYQLQTRLTNQAGVEHGLDVYAGHPVLVTMFYGTCPATCPLLIDTLRAAERAASPAQRQRLRVLLISIDPQHDTVQSLQELARSRRIDPSRWTLARTDAATVRRIARRGVQPLQRHHAIDATGRNSDAEHGSRQSRRRADPGPLGHSLIRGLLSGIPRIRSRALLNSLRHGAV
jgi:hypothetical protein